MTVASTHSTDNHLWRRRYVMISIAEEAKALLSPTESIRQGRSSSPRCDASFFFGFLTGKQYQASIDIIYSFDPHSDCSGNRRRCSACRCVFHPRLLAIKLGGGGGIEPIFSRSMLQQGGGMSRRGGDASTARPLECGCSCFRDLRATKTVRTQSCATSLVGHGTCSVLR